MRAESRLFWGIAVVPLTLFAIAALVWASSDPARYSSTGADLITLYVAMFGCFWFAVDFFIWVALKLVRWVIRGG